MTKEQKVRILAHGYVGKAREGFILALMTNPHKIDELFKGHAKQMSCKERMRKVRAGKVHGDKSVNFAMRLTPDEYLTIRDGATSYGMNMAEYIRFQVFGPRMRRG